MNWKFWKRHTGEVISHEDYTKLSVKHQDQFTITNDAPNHMLVHPHQLPNERQVRYVDDSNSIMNTMILENLILSENNNSSNSIAGPDPNPVSPDFGGFGGGSGGGGGAGGDWSAPNTPDTSSDTSSNDNSSSSSDYSSSSSDSSSYSDSSSSYDSGSSSSGGGGDY